MRGDAYIVHKCRVCSKSNASVVAKNYSRYSYKSLKIFKVLPPPEHLHIFCSAIYPGTVRGDLIQRGRHGGLDPLNAVQTFEDGFNPRGLWQRCRVGRNLLWQELADVQSDVARSIGVIEHPGSGDLLSYMEEPVLIF